MEVDALRQEIQRLSEIINEIEVSRTHARSVLAERLAQFKLGDIITWPGRSGARKGEVVGFRLAGHDTVAYQVKSLRKDGSYGIEIEVQEWKKPTVWVP